MRALVIEADLMSPAGYIGEAAEARGYELDRIQVCGRADAFDDIAEPDLVIVPGSDEHWYDIADQPHLQRELEVLTGFVDRNVPILGMCWGGQALSMALGGEVKPLGFTEIGWIEIETRDAELIPTGPWFEWHADHFIPPDDVEILAENDVSMQAFRSGPHLGLQFHPEVSPAMLENWIDHVADSGGDPVTFMADTRRHAADARERAHHLFDRFLEMQT